MVHNGVTFKQCFRARSVETTRNTHNSTHQAQDKFEHILTILLAQMCDIVKLTQEQKEALYVNGSVVPNDGAAATVEIDGQRLFFGPDYSDGAPAFFIAAEGAKWVVTMIRAQNGATVYYDGISQDTFEAMFGEI